MKNLKIFSTVAEYQAYSATTTDAHVAYISAIDKCVCNKITPLVPSLPSIKYEFTLQEAKTLTVYTGIGNLKIDGVKIDNPTATLIDTHGAYGYNFDAGTHTVEIELTNGIIPSSFYRILTDVIVPREVIISDGITTLKDDCLGGINTGVYSLSWGNDVTSIGSCVTTDAFFNNAEIFFRGTMAELRAKQGTCGHEVTNGWTVQCTDGNVNWIFNNNID